MSFHQHSTSLSPCSSLNTIYIPRKQWPTNDSEYWVWKRTAWCSCYLPLAFVKAGEKQEVTWAHWVRTPLASESVRRPVEEMSGVGGAHNMCLREQTELLQPYIHGNCLRHNFIPCWGLLFVEWKWVKEVKLRTQRVGSETSVEDTHPLSAALLKIVLTAHVDAQCLTMKTLSNSPPVRQSSFWDSWHWDWEASWGSDANELRSLRQLF